MAKFKDGGSKGDRPSRPNYPRNKPSTTVNKSGGGRSNNTSGRRDKGK